MMRAHRRGVAAASVAIVALGLGAGGAQASGPPVFIKTLAGPSVADIYSSGLQWDAVNQQIVVADTGNNQIEFYNPTSGDRTGSFGSFGSGNGQLNSPRQVAIDGAGNIYVADAGNNRVEKFSSAGVFEAVTAGTPSSKCTSTQAASACLNAPIGVSWDATNNQLLVADTGDNLIKALTPSLGWLWTSPAGSSLNVLNPRDMTRGPGGYIWVSAYQENQIKAFAVSASGVWSTTPAVVLGDGSAAGHGNNELINPYNVAFSPDGQTAYVADIGNDRVAVYDIASLSSPQWEGQLGHRCTTPCSTAQEPPGQFQFLRRVAVESNGDIIADDFWGNAIFVWAPTATPTRSTPVALEIEGFHAPAPGFAQAFGVAVGSDGTTYGVDRLNQRIERFSASGTFLNAAGVRGSTTILDAFSWPESVAVAPDGTVWIADTRNSRLEHWPADLSLPSPYPDVGTKGSGLGQFNYIEGVSVDAQGVVWIADSNNNRIESYDPTTGSFAVYGSRGTGTCQFNHPEAVVNGSNGEVYVADSLNNRVVAMTVSGSSCTGFAATYSTGLSGPQGIAQEGDGTIWVANSGDNDVVHLTAGLSEIDSFGGAGTGNLEFDDPHSLALSGTTLFVADTYNNRIQEFDISGT